MTHLHINVITYMGLFGVEEAVVITTTIVKYVLKYLHEDLEKFAAIHTMHYWEK